MIAIRLFISSVLGLTTNSRRLILIGIDSLNIIFSFSICLSLIHENSIFNNLYSRYSWILLLLLLIGFPIYQLTGHYKPLTRYVGSYDLYRIVLRNIFLVLIIYFFSFLPIFEKPSIRFFILLWLILSVFTGSIKFILRDILLKINYNSNSKNVVIYGAGAAGSQLASVIKAAGNINILGFIRSISYPSMSAKTS